MKTFTATLQGTTALLMHRWTETAETEAATRKVHIGGEDPRAVAERFAYRLPDGGGLYLPGASLARLLREQGASHKQRGSRKSLRYVVPAAVLVLEDTLALTNGNGKAAHDFEVDSRPVTIPATKGRVMRHRPRLNVWGLQATLEIDESMIDADIVQQLLTEGGRAIGLGDFRPEKGGPFGRYIVTGWQLLPAPQVRR